MEDKPNYYAIIPAEVRYDSELKDKAKLLYAEITALANKTGCCYASNKYFADLYGVSTTTISLLIKNLVESGYVESEIIYKEGTKEILNRYLRILKGGYLRNLKEGYLRKVKDNNTSINNTSINNKYIDDDEINNLFLDFLETRKKKKIPNTERAIKLLLNKLSICSKEEQKTMLEESIVRGWTSVFPKNKDLPKWVNEKQEKEEIDETELIELKNMMKDFK